MREASPPGLTPYPALLLLLRRVKPAPVAGKAARYKRRRLFDLRHGHLGHQRLPDGPLYRAEDLASFRNLTSLLAGWMLTSTSSGGRSIEMTATGWRPVIIKPGVGLFDGEGQDPVGHPAPVDEKAQIAAAAPVYLRRARQTRDFNARFPFASRPAFRKPVDGEHFLRGVQSV